MDTAIVVPFLTLEPVSGSWETMRSLSLSESTVVTLPSSRPTAFRALRAWSWLMPTRSGTSTWSEPEDRYAVIVWPALTLEPGEGLVWATLPSATVSEATLLELTSHFRPKASTA